MIRPSFPTSLFSQTLPRNKAMASLLFFNRNKGHPNTAAAEAAPRATARHPRARAHRRQSPARGHGRPAL